MSAVALTYHKTKDRRRRFEASYVERIPGVPPGTVTHEKRSV